MLCACHVNTILADPSPDLFPVDTQLTSLSLAVKIQKIVFGVALTCYSLVSTVCMLCCNHPGQIKWLVFQKKTLNLHLNLACII